MALCDRVSFKLRLLLSTGVTLGSIAPLACKSAYSQVKEVDTVVGGSPSAARVADVALATKGFSNALNEICGELILESNPAVNVPVRALKLNAGGASGACGLINASDDPVTQRLIADVNAPVNSERFVCLKSVNDSIAAPLTSDGRLSMTGFGCTVSVESLRVVPRLPTDAPRQEDFSAKVGLAPFLTSDGEICGTLQKVLIPGLNAAVSAMPLQIPGGPIVFCSVLHRPTTDEQATYSDLADEITYRASFHDARASVCLRPTKSVVELTKFDDNKMPLAPYCVLDFGAIRRID